MPSKTSSLYHGLKSAKELSFCDLFVEIGNATEAYRLSKYSQNMSENSKRITAYKLLQKPHILAYIDKKQTERDKQAAIQSGVTREEVLQEIREGLKLAKQRNSLNNIARFLELLGRLGGLYTDNLNTNNIAEQRKLDMIEEREARALAEMRLDQLQAKPKQLEQGPGPIQLDIVQNVVPITETVSVTLAEQ